jgi:hypothetical protein
MKLKLKLVGKCNTVYTEYTDIENIADVVSKLQEPKQEEAGVANDKNTGSSEKELTFDEIMEINSIISAENKFSDVLKKYEENEDEINYPKETIAGELGETVIIPSSTHMDKIVNGGVATIIGKIEDLIMVEEIPNMLFSIEFLENNQGKLRKLHGDCKASVIMAK